MCKKQKVTSDFITFWMPLSLRHEGGWKYVPTQIMPRRDVLRTASGRSKVCVGTYFSYHSTLLLPSSSAVIVTLVQSSGRRSSISSGHSRKQRFPL